MLECCSIVTWCILSATMLLIAESCHSCFACHLQTMHPFPVIFISISTEIISSFQWHTWYAKLMPWSFFPFRSTHMHCISHLAYHAMYCIMLLVHCPWLIVGPLLVFLFWVEPGDENAYRNLLRTLTRIKLSTTLRTLQARWPYPRNHFYLCFASCSFYCYGALPTTCYIMPPILPCQASNHPFLANRCLAKLPLLLSPSYSVASCRWSWSWFHVGTWILWNITISLI